METVTSVDNTVLYNWKLLRVDLKHSHHQEKNFNCVVTDVNAAHSGDHFIIFANIESLRCAPKTNIMSHVNVKHIAI